ISNKPELEDLSERRGTKPERKKIHMNTAFVFRKYFIKYDEDTSRRAIDAAERVIQFVKNTLRL
ncbi:MAG: hypothetical protein QXJ36_04835, partial [Desulfurococcaceae archaeon]